MELLLVCKTLGSELIWDPRPPHSQSSPLPVNSDLNASLQDQTPTEFAGRGVGGEGQKLGRLFLKRVCVFSKASEAEIWVS